MTFFADASLAPSRTRIPIRCAFPLCPGVPQPFPASLCLLDSPFVSTSVSDMDAQIAERQPDVTGVSGRMGTVLYAAEPDYGEGEPQLKQILLLSFSEQVMMKHISLPT